MLYAHSVFHTLHEMPVAYKCTERHYIPYADPECQSHSCAIRVMAICLRYIYIILLCTIFVLLWI